MRNRGKWDFLAYWQSGEWQVVKEKLDEEGEPKYNPPRSVLFAALRRVSPEACRVVVLGQDPYPRADYCTGIAFSIPRGLKKFPATLVNIFQEYQADLGYPAPKNGDLTKWCEQGVLLWNVYPSVAIGRPGSHHWPEWEYLTKEILHVLDNQTSHPIVFVALGRVAGSFLAYVPKARADGRTIEVSHPSPLSFRKSFSGSKLFTKINSLLSIDNKIDWKLDG